jgi:hypothetical protein
MTANVSEDVEKEEHSPIVGGLQADTTTLEISLAVPQKIEIILPEDPEIPLLGTYPEDALTCNNDTC